MTLTDLLPAIRQLSDFEKVRLMGILAEELDTTEDISPLQPNKVYSLPTPYNTFGAGQALMAALAEEVEKRKFIYAERDHTCSSRRDLSASRTGCNGNTAGCDRCVA